MFILVGVFGLGPWELGIVLVIVILLFGVGRLPEVGSAVGKGIREFRHATKDDEAKASENVALSLGPAESGSAAPPAADTMFCGECGSRIARSAKFCPSCGKPVQPPGD